MSDSYSIICTAKEIENPKQIADKVIGWLQDENIIEKEKSDCVLSLKGFGYKPSIDYLKAVLYDENISRLAVCGVEVKTEREVFNAMAFTALTSMECPWCAKNRFEGITTEDFFSDKITNEQFESYRSVYDIFDKWTNNEKAELTCPYCNSTIGIDDYKIGSGICISNLGLTFWNWPEFKPEFIDEIKQKFETNIKVIAGHI